MTVLESAARSLVVRALRHLDAVPIENAVGAGTPDINHRYGWIELKVFRNGVGLRHFTPQQRAWIVRRAVRGGLVQVLVYDEGTWWLFDGEWAARTLKGCSRAGWVQNGLRMDGNKDMNARLGFLVESGHALKNHSIG